MFLMSEAPNTERAYLRENERLRAKLNDLTEENDKLRADRYDLNGRVARQDDELDATKYKLAELTEALRLIEKDGCEHYYGMGYYCPKTTRTKDSKHWVNRWCHACIAHDALQTEPEGE